MTDETVDVLVAGAGPVGLSLAIELGHRGIGCLVVERNDRVGYSPRAKTTNVRTREHLRRWGIADALRQASPIPPDYPPNVVFATRMNGPLLARFENAMHGRRERNELFSEEGQWVPQYTLEEVLRAHAVSLPSVRIEFGHALSGVEQDEGGVTAQVRHVQTGDSRTVRSRYLVGADGARSFVRDAIGARMQGDAPALKNYSIIFRAPDLAARQVHGEAIMYWLVNADVPALLGPMDRHGLWFFMATKLANDVDPASVDPVALIRRGTGLADLDIEVVRADPWVAHSLIADTYSKGRLFLAGDACHLHPPFGGFGMNMGIGDAVDLGWKLAAVIKGWGGPKLLPSYQQERRPVHERVINEAMINTRPSATSSSARRSRPPAWRATAHGGRWAPPSSTPRAASSTPWASSWGIVIPIRPSWSPMARRHRPSTRSTTSRPRCRDAWRRISGSRMGPRSTTISGRGTRCWPPTGQGTTLTHLPPTPRHGGCR